MVSAIATIMSLKYGNRLQNYVVYQYVKKLLCQSENL